MVIEERETSQKHFRTFYIFLDISEERHLMSILMSHFKRVSE
jgi:hypothetical protein